MEMFYLKIRYYDAHRGCYETENVDIMAENMKEALAKYQETLPSLSKIVSVAMRLRR